MCFVATRLLLPKYFYAEHIESRYLSSTTLIRMWDPEVKQFFRKILNSISLGLLWMIAALFTGIYFGWDNIYRKPVYVPIIFYAILISSFLLLLFRLYKIWKTK